VNVREANLSLVLRTALGAPGDATLSRAGVAAATSLTRSTVSRLVDELVGAGLLRELEPAGRPGPGRPGRPLVPGHGIAALGLQVNAGYLAARVLDLAGAEVVAGRLEGHQAGRAPEAVLAELGELARGVLGRLPDGVRVVGAGLALPGIVTAGSGELMLAPNLGWQELDVAPMLGLPEELGVGLRIANEASLAAAAAATEAPGRKRRRGDFIYLSGEVGIGGAVLLGGRAMEGDHGWFGEVGHMCVDPHGPPCPCGSTGCLERYAGKDAVFDATGHALDGDAIERAAWALGVALGSAINLLDVPTVVLGGHLGQLCEELRPTLQSVLDARVISSRWVRPTVHAAPEDPAPGATGAALTQLDRVLDRPARWMSPS
jgi:predicted NBD/HSP70 family sugar kinase